MRLPDLNWPGNLFTDAIIPSPETIAVASVTAAAKPTLWRRIMGSCIEKDVLPDPRWHVSLVELEQVAV